MNIISKASNHNSQSDSSCQIRHNYIILLQKNTPNGWILRQLWLYNGNSSTCGLWMEVFVCSGADFISKLEKFTGFLNKALHYSADDSTQHFSTHHVSYVTGFNHYSIHEKISSQTSKYKVIFLFMNFLFINCRDSDKVTFRENYNDIGKLEMIYVIKYFIVFFMEWHKILNKYFIPVIVCV